MVQGSERRAAHRAPLGTKVSWKVMGQSEWHEDSSQNVSSTGMMLRTQEIVKPGANLKMKFKLPNLKFQDPISADVEVVRVVERNGRQAGLGLRFLTLKSHNYKVVHEFVCRILDLPLDEDMEGVGSKVGEDYTFTMEKLAREAEARKVARQEKKMAEAEARRQKEARQLWTGRAVKIGFLGLGLFILFKIISFFTQLADKVPSVQ